MTGFRKIRDDSCLSSLAGQLSDNGGHRLQVLIPDDKIRDAVACARSLDLGADLLVIADEEVRRTEHLRAAQTVARGKLFGDALAVCGDNYFQDQEVEFQVGETLSSSGAHPGQFALKRGWQSIVDVDGLVDVIFDAGRPGAGSKADNIGISAREGEHFLAAATHEEGWRASCLICHDPDLLDAVVLASKGDLLPGQQRFDDLHSFRQARDAGTR
jgi:hypothetical protein